MYNEYFGFKEAPFSIAPDPRYLYMSGQHREALAHLVYGFNSEGGFVLITGEVGTGKTTVCRCMLEQMPENTAIAFIINPKLTVEELLATVCDEFGIDYPKGTTSIKTFVDLINLFLIDAHSKSRKAVLIIDEAQNLSSDVLEQLRLLTNLETNRHKLLQIILLGQPELRDKLSRPELRQLSQRIIARYHLGALSRNDIGAYVSYRLSVAGARERVFADSTFNTLFRLSGGIPRLINVLCDRSLLGAYALSRREVNKPIIKRAAREVFGGSGRPGQYMKVSMWLMSILMIVVVGVVLAATYYRSGPVEAPVQESVKPQIPEPVVLQALRWPDDQSVERSNVMAFQELFRIWGLTYDPALPSSPCRQAEAQGVRCYEDLGNLMKLRNLNRPAVLKLSDDQDREFYAALVGLKEGSALVVAGTETREVSLNDIEKHWLGSYTILWKPPSEYTRDIMPGDSDPLVIWLDKQMALLQGREAQTRDDQKFGDELVNEVRKFQLAKGLVPDGIVGTHTLIQLNSDTDSGTPRLFNSHGVK